VRHAEPGQSNRVFVSAPRHKNASSLGRTGRSTVE
jgi:hypothetical protein